MVSYPLYFPHPLILNMTIFVVAPLLLLLHDLDSLLPSAFHHALLVHTPCAAPPLRISCSGSLPCPFDTRSTSEHLALNVLHTTFSSDSPGAITCLMVYWVATCPKSSPSLVTQVCTWSSLRLWLTEGPRDQAGGQLHLLWLCLPRCSFKCNILHFSVLNLTSQTEYSLMFQVLAKNCYIWFCHSFTFIWSKRMMEGAVRTDRGWFRDSKTQSQNLYEKCEHNCSNGYLTHIYDHLNCTCTTGAIHMCRIRKYNSNDQKITSYLAWPAHYVLH